MNNHSIYSAKAQPIAERDDKFVNGFVLFCQPHKRVPEKVSTDEENRARPFRTNRCNPCRAPRFSAPSVDNRPAAKQA
jgi:hypothetical protein